MSIFDILSNFREGLLSGLLVTLKLCLIVWAAGLFLGSIIGILGAKWHLPVGVPSRAISFILSGVPVLAFLFWLHYPLQTMLHVVIDPFYTAAAALSIINIFAVSDVVRGVLRDFPTQYILAAQASGLSQSQILLNIQAPIILRQILPSLLTIQVSMLQATLFASLISVEELFRVAQRINAIIYRPVEIYTALALLFLVICLPLNGLALWLKAKFTRDLSET